MATLSAIQPLLSVDKDTDYINLKIDNTRNSIAKDLYNAATSLNTDPGNYKKKALAGAATTALGAIALATTANNSAITTTANNIPRSILATLTRYTFPAGIYYAVQNFADRPKRSIGGAATAAGSLAILSNEISNSPVSKDALDQAKKAIGIGGGAVVLPAIYTMHQLENAKREEDLQNLKNNTTLDPITKAELLNGIRNKKDMYARYPALRLIPGSGILRDFYNEHHKPNSNVSAKDAQEFRLLVPEKEYNKMRYKND